MKVMLKKEAGSTANFSVILPGPCNAKCKFCFWKRNQEESPMFAQQLSWYLNVLGQTITQISLTGGEPTISPVFDDVINSLRLFSERKIVLTTNGTKLKEKLPMLEGVVRHINISRHAVAEQYNYDAFQTTSVPSTKELDELCDMANSLNIDITLNKVVPHDYQDVADFKMYVAFAKSIGASAVAFRKDYSANSLDITPIEKGLGRAGTSRSCPVCATNTYLYSGMPIHFKMSLEEPSDVLPYIYEFVYHPNGKLTEDWKAKKEIEFMQRESFSVNKPIKRSSVESLYQVVAKGKVSSLYTDNCGNPSRKDNCGNPISRGIGCNSGRSSC